MKTILRKHELIKAKNDDLLEAPVVIEVNKFDEKAASDFRDQISDAHNTGQPVIPVVIDSYGGQVYSLLSMITDIENAILPVATICVGKAMSCGSVLLAWGDEGYRYIAPNARVMIHDVSAMEWGKVEELKAGTKEVEFLNDHLFRELAKKTGQRDEEYFLKKIHDKGHAEWYMSGEEAKKHKIVNHVKIPTLTANVNVEYTFE